MRGSAPQFSKWGGGHKPSFAFSRRESVPHLHIHVPPAKSTILIIVVYLSIVFSHRRCNNNITDVAQEVMDVAQEVMMHMQHLLR